MKPTRLSLLFCTSILAWGSAVVSVAMPPDKNRPQFALGKEESAELPVTLEADTISYDQQAQVATAEGHVEVVQGDTILLADRLSYSQRSNEIFASGNVSLLESTGNVYFADRLQLKDSLLQGTVTEFRTRLSDESVFAAREARRLNDHQTELLKAVYSPCSVKCADGSPKTPMWQIRADHALIDTEKQKAIYHNAYFEAYGVPVLYTPYISHATPGAENKSGFLIPEYRHSTNIGSVYSVPYYYVIGQDKDVTVTPMFTSTEGVILAGEYRQLFDNGHITARGSATNPQNRDSSGDRVQGHKFRGHIFAEGDFRLSDAWGWGFDVDRTTDDTYLRRYEFSQDTLLTSNLYLKGLDFVPQGRISYASIQALAFQGLTITDDLKRTPFVAPLANFDYQSALMRYDSRFSLNGNVMSLMREEGADSRRLSATGQWNVPYVTEGGHMFELATKLRTDVYYVNDVLQANGAFYDGTTGRVVPEATLDWRYPLMKRFETSSWIIEPQMRFTVSPRGINSTKIPNEDSASPEFSDLNLFSDNRFPGYDRLESGPRINYGIRSQLNFTNGRYAEAVFGQDYRVINDPLFPLTNDLRSHFSDYVGRVSTHIAPIDLSYQFRLDKDGLTPNRQQVDVMAAFNRFSLNGAYLKLNDDPVLGSREEIYGNTNFKLTDQWSASVSARHNLQQNSAINGGLGLVFQNECLTLTTMATRDLITDRDVRPSTTFRFQIGLKNLE